MSLTPHQEPALPTNRLQKQRLAYLESLEKQILQAQSELESLTNQVTAARSRHSQTLIELQKAATATRDQTSRQVEAEAEQLRQANQVLKAEQAKQQAELDVIIEAIDNARANREIVELELHSLVEDISTKDKLLRDYEQTIAERETEVQGLITTLEQARAQLTEARDSLLSLQQEATVFQQEQEDLRSDLLATNQELTEKKLDLETTLARVEKSLAGRTAQLQEVSGQDEAMRRALADERQRLDKFDQNLRVREERVKQGEDKLVRNSQLLSL